MPYVNDMQTLADIVGGPTAAAQMQTQNDAANQEQAIKNQVAQAQAPAMGQQQAIANQETQARTGVFNQQAQGQQLTNQATQATQPGAIAATNAGNSAAMTADQAKKLGTYGQIAGQVAGMMDNVPPAARPAAMQQMLSQYGVDPKMLGPLANGDPDALRNFSQKAIQASSGFQTTMAEAALKGQNQLAVAGQEGKDRLAATQALVGGREQVAQTSAAAKTQTLNSVQAGLEAKVANGTATPQEISSLNQLRQLVQMGKVNPMIAQMLNQSNAPATVPQVPQAGGGQQSPQSLPTAGAVLQAAKQAWPNDDPSKYDYRQGPDGTLQRKAK